MTSIATDTLATELTAVAEPTANGEHRLDAFAQLQLAEPLARAVAEMGYAGVDVERVSILTLVRRS